jgi:hypothetical protein
VNTTLAGNWCPVADPDASRCTRRKELNLFDAVLLWLAQSLAPEFSGFPVPLPPSSTPSVLSCSDGCLEESSRYVAPCHWLNSAQFSLAPAASAFICGTSTARCPPSYMPGLCFSLFIRGASRPLAVAFWAVRRTRVPVECAGDEGVKRYGHSRTHHNT